MKNDKVLLLQYGNIPYLSMVRELDQERTARRKAEEIMHEYRRFMTWLETQEEYPIIITKWNKKRKHE